ncbi:hypothetical protein Goshw_006878, partial [Gossypium schwendimanii]|nr:hypothetical protein [Gossypium schwendimanii]
MNLDGPFNSFIASRGLIPIHVSISQRLPLFENTLDIVHSMHILSNWIPDAMLEFALYDIYRVLRPRGLFWLDHFFCQGPQLNQTYAPMFDRIGFTKLRWNVGKKVDRGVDKNEWYLSAISPEKQLYLLEAINQRHPDAARRTRASIVKEIEATYEARKNVGKGEEPLLLDASNCRTTCSNEDHTHCETQCTFFIKEENKRFKE